MIALIHRFPSRVCLPAFGFLLLYAGVAGAADLKPVQPFLKAHCYDCHDGNSAKGGLDLEARHRPDQARPAVQVGADLRPRRPERDATPKKAKAAEPQKPAFLASLNVPLTQASAGQRTRSSVG